MAGDLKCAYCEKSGELHRDHVVPRSRGGPDNAANIVMACQSCNSSKGDQLPSEWLGERCPAAVLLIEARANAKLKSLYKRRDPKADAAAAQYAFTFAPSGEVRYIGRVVSEGAEFVRVEPVNILHLWGGIWDLSGELVDVPRADCRLFLDRDACLDAAEREMSRR